MAIQLYGFFHVYFILLQRSHSLASASCHLVVFSFMRRARSVRNHDGLFSIAASLVAGTAARLSCVLDLSIASFSVLKKGSR